VNPGRFEDLRTGHGVLRRGTEHPAPVHDHYDGLRNEGVDADEWSRLDVQTHLLERLPAGTLFCRFAQLQVASREGPEAERRLDSAADEKDAAVALRQDAGDNPGVEV
jgi:hypothetical protein